MKKTISIILTFFALSFLAQAETHDYESTNDIAFSGIQEVKAVTVEGRYFIGFKINAPFLISNMFTRGGSNQLSKEFYFRLSDNKGTKILLNDYEDLIEYPNSSLFIVPVEDLTDIKDATYRVLPCFMEEEVEYCQPNLVKMKLQ